MVELVYHSYYASHNVYVLCMSFMPNIISGGTMIKSRVTINPDQGMAWLVLAGSVVCNICCSVYAISGAMTVLFLEVFQKSKATTAWLTGTHAAVTSLVGK